MGYQSYFGQGDFKTRHTSVVVFTRRIQDTEVGANNARRKGEAPFSFSVCGVVNAGKCDAISDSLNPSYSQPSNVTVPLTLVRLI